MHKKKNLTIAKKKHNKKTWNNPSSMLDTDIHARHSDYTKLNCTLKYLLWELVYMGSIHVQQRISAGQ